MKFMVLLAALLFATTAHAQAASTGTINGKWVNPPTGSASSPGTRMDYSADSGATWLPGCTAPVTATTCASQPVPLGTIYRVRFVRLAVDAQFNSDPTGIVLVGAIKEPTPTGMSATISINP